MKYLDRVLQRWRIAQARPYIENGSRVLDIGCADGSLFQQLGSRINEGIGVDPDLHENTAVGNVQLVKGFFPDAIRDARHFDVITMLAVLEHVPASACSKLAADCAAYLRPGGYLVITVPSPLVDHILNMLSALRLIDGMSLEQHHGFDVTQTPGIFIPAQFRLVRHSRFQLGLNNLFVFQHQPAKECQTG